MPLALLIASHIYVTRTSTPEDISGFGRNISSKHGAILPQSNLIYHKKRIRTKDSKLSLLWRDVNTSVSGRLSLLTQVGI
jgi:hypothetical protein